MDSLSAFWTFVARKETTRTMIEMNNKMRRELLLIYKEYIKETVAEARKIVSKMSDEDVTNLAVQFMAFYYDSSFIEQVSDDKEVKDMHFVFNEFMRLNMAVALNGRYKDVEIDKPAADNNEVR